MTTTLLATLLALLLLPLLIIWRLSMSPQQKARYYVRQRGWSQRKTAQFLRISRHAVRVAVA
jgi:ABC-type spermidine/putrescine transport system permease subunit II